MPAGPFVGAGLLIILLIRVRHRIQTQGYQQSSISLMLLCRHNTIHYTTLQYKPIYTARPITGIRSLSPFYIWTRVSAFIDCTNKPHTHYTDTGAPTKQHFNYAALLVHRIQTQTQDHNQSSMSTMLVCWSAGPFVGGGLLIM